MDEVVKKSRLATFSPGTLVGMARARLRFVLLVALPAVVLLAGLAIYFTGGRYVSTDNAYVGARKVLITPDISGQVAAVMVHEGDHVAAGDPLFLIDDQPYRLALQEAQGELETVRAQFASLKSNYQALSKLVEIGEQAAELRRNDVERKQALARRSAESQSALDEASATFLMSELQVQVGKQQLSNTLNQLRGNPELPIESYPPYQQAKAVADQAQRDLDHTAIRAPIDGMATQVDQIQLGRFVSAGTPVFSVIDDKEPWIDANPKETEITHVRPGQKVRIAIDSFPSRKFTGTVASLSPGTGAQFAILPPQNATGNWVKVVQRVPMRITFDEGQDVSLLRAGMSARVKIDTEHNRLSPARP